MHDTLAARCAAFGWTLLPLGDDRWELRGNGAPAEFSSSASLAAWLERQERGRDVVQLRLELAA